jgi:hypothetical protein
MNSTADQGEFKIVLRLVVKVLTKFLLFDIPASIIIFIVFGSPNFTNILSSSNFHSLFFTFATILTLTGIIVLLGLSFTAQRTRSVAVMTSQWGRSPGGPTRYSDEIISRQMRDLPKVIAAFICFVLGLILIGLLN